METEFILRSDTEKQFWNKCLGCRSERKHEEKIPRRFTVRSELFFHSPYRGMCGSPA